MSAIQSKKVDLWAGNMSVQLPTSFIDASNIRPVPSHQEVWLDQDGPANVIFSLNQMVDVASDEEAATFHLDDQVEEDVYRIWQNKPVFAERFPSTTRGRYLVATVKNRDDHSVDFVGIVMIMLRLREYQTDLVITISVPHVGGHYDTRGMDLSEGRLGSLMESANILKDAIAHSLECADFSFLLKEEDKDEVMSD